MNQFNIKAQTKQIFLALMGNGSQRGRKGSGGLAWLRKSEFSATSALKERKTKFAAVAHSAQPNATQWPIAHNQVAARTQSAEGL
jgi:hypothetical protein